jgi:hypothetical protein
MAATGRACHCCRLSLSGPLTDSFCRASEDLGEHADRDIEWASQHLTHVVCAGIKPHASPDVGSLDDRIARFRPVQVAQAPPVSVDRVTKPGSPKVGEPWTVNMLSTRAVASAATKSASRRARRYAWRLPAADSRRAQARSPRLSRVRNSRRCRGNARPARAAGHL